jgi:hypothetical protein
MALQTIQTKVQNGVGAPSGDEESLAVDLGRVGIHRPVHKSFGGEDVRNGCAADSQPVEKIAIAA